MSKFKGLPQEKKAKPDLHFVEELFSTRTESVGRYIDLKKIDVNPFQPRKDFGDLNDLVYSIKEKGVLEPILVRSNKGRYEIIAGERRYQASKIAGIKQIPCIEVEVDDGGSLEISLIENLQRKNLDPFEEATALQNLCQYFEYTHEQVAKRIGKSRTSITEILSLNRIPENIKEMCRHADIDSKSMLLQIARLENENDMILLIERIKSDGYTREEARNFKKDREEKKPKQFCFSFKPDDKAFSLSIRFKKQKVEKEELISALEALIEKIKEESSL